jgi:hypothetical protein
MLTAALRSANRCLLKLFQSKMLADGGATFEELSAFLDGEILVAGATFAGRDAFAEADTGFLESLYRDDESRSRDVATNLSFRDDGLSRETVPSGNLTAAERREMRLIVECACRDYPEPLGPLNAADFARTIPTLKDGYFHVLRMGGRIAAFFHVDQKVPGVSVYAR